MQWQMIPKLSWEFARTIFISIRIGLPVWFRSAADTDAIWGVGEGIQICLLANTCARSSRLVDSGHTRDLGVTISEKTYGNHSSSCIVRDKRNALFYKVCGGRGNCDYAGSLLHI